MIRAILPQTTPIVSPPARRRAHRSFKKADVLRAMDAVRAGGLSVAIVEIRPDGTIRLSAAEAASESNGDAFVEWENRL